MSDIFDVGRLMGLPPEWVETGRTVLDAGFDLLEEAAALDHAYRAMLARLDLTEKELEREIQRLRARERMKRVGLGGRLPGEVDIKLYPLFAYRTAAAEIAAPYLMALLYMTPQVGFVLVMHDVITGRNFFTGEELAGWERVLSAGLAVLPLLAGPLMRATGVAARGVGRAAFAAVRAGDDGALIAVATLTGLSAKDTMRLVRGLSRLQAAELRAAVVETRVARAQGTGGANFTPAHARTAQRLTAALPPASTTPRGATSGASGGRRSASGGLPQPVPARTYAKVLPRLTDVQIQRLSKLLHGGLGVGGRRALQRALQRLSPARRRDLVELQRRNKKALALLDKGDADAAYRLVQDSRDLGDRVYSAVQREYWRQVRQDSALVRAWKATGADMSGTGAPKVPVRVTRNGVTTDTTEVITLEHLTRRTDNPFRTVDASNLTYALKYENSVLLESIRRVERSQGAVFTTDPIERLMLSRAPSPQ